MVSPDQFNGLPLVAGDVRGIRAWSVDSLGRLRSPQFSDCIWTPGENLAVCYGDNAQSPMGRYLSSLSGQSSRPTRPTHYAIGSTDRPVPLGPMDLDPKDLAHHINQEKFYINKAHYLPALQVVEFVLESRYGGERSKLSVPVTELTNFTPPVVEPHSISKCTCGFYAYLNGVNDFQGAGNVVGVIQGYGECVLGTRGFKATKARVVAVYVPTVDRYIDAETPADVLVRKSTLPVSGDRLKTLYPEVKFYEDYDEMVAAHPPSEPDVTPETDEDFWTREAS